MHCVNMVWKIIIIIVDHDDDDMKVMICFIIVSMKFKHIYLHNLPEEKNK